MTLQVGVCVPKECTSEDVTNTYNLALSAVGIKAGALCQNRDYSLEGGTIVLM